MVKTKLIKRFAILDKSRLSSIVKTAKSVKACEKWLKKTDPVDANYDTVYIIVPMYMFDSKSKPQKDMGNLDGNDESLGTLLQNTELSTTNTKLLAKYKIHTVGHLVQKTEKDLLAHKDFGIIGLSAVKDMLLGYKLNLKPETVESNETV